MFRKRSHLYINITVFFIFTFMLISTPAKAEVYIEASMNPAIPSVGEPVELLIAIVGADQRIKQPTLPIVKGFTQSAQSHSDETTITNGKRTTKTIFSYTLIPYEDGPFTIPSLDVEVGSVIYRTGQIGGVVQEAGQAPQRFNGAPSPTVVPPSSPNLPDEFLTNQETFVRAWVDKDEVYVNEPTALNYTLYTRVSATFKGFDSEPVTTGFWVEDFPSQGAQTRHQKNIGQYRYLIADVRGLALFPLKSGTYDLNPGTLKVDVQIEQNDPFNQFYSRQVFGRRTMNVQKQVTQIHPRILQTEPIPIKVKPLPAGMPDGFTGAVGQYSISAAIDTDKVKTGEAITHTLIISGKGNLTTLEMPQLPALQSFSVYDGGKTVELNKDRFMVEGEKRVDTILIPSQAGTFTVPAVEFSYFDYRTEKYVTIKSPSFKVQVTGASIEPPTLPKRSEPLQKQFTENETPLSAGYPVPKPRESAGSIPNPWLPGLHDKSLWQLVLCLTGIPLILLILTRLTALLFKAPAGNKVHKKAQSTARRRLRSAAGLMKSDKHNEFLNALSAGVTDYFSGRFKIGRGSVGASYVTDKLKGKIAEDDVKRVDKLFKDIDYARFSSATLTENEMKTLYDEADNLIRYMEGKRF